MIPTIVSLGLANEVQIAEAVAEFAGLPFVKLNPLELDLDIVTGGRSARIKRDQNGREIELRVSTMPTAFGEKAVLRIFDPDVLLKDVDSRPATCRCSGAFSRVRMASSS